MKKLFDGSLVADATSTVAEAGGARLATPAEIAGRAALDAAAPTQAQALARLEMQAQAPAMVEAVADLVDALVGKGLIADLDIPKPTRDLLARRKILKAQVKV